MLFSRVTDSKLSRISCAQVRGINENGLKDFPKSLGVARRAFTNYRKPRRRITTFVACVASGPTCRLSLRSLCTTSRTVELT